jgi:hypothetical protein
MRIVKVLLFLALPIWGLVLVLWLLSLIRSVGQMPGDGLIFLGVVLILAGAVPIFSAPGAGVSGLVGKAFLFALYFAVCAVAMFVVGWGALGLFGVAK